MMTMTVSLKRAPMKAPRMRTTQTQKVKVSHIIACLKIGGGGGAVETAVK